MSAPDIRVVFCSLLRLRLRSIWTSAADSSPARRYGLHVEDGRFSLNVSTKNAAIGLGALLLVLIIYPLVAGGDTVTVDGGTVTVEAGCSLPAPVGKWNVEYFGSNRLDIPVATQCESPNRPQVVDNGATAAVLAFYAAVDEANARGIAAAVGPDYSATVHGCATIGGTHYCSETGAPRPAQSEQWTGGQTFDAAAFRSLISSNPPRPGGRNINRALTVDAGKDGQYVVLNQYTLAAADGGGAGTAVHTVVGCPANCKVASSVWMAGSLDPTDVAGETASATMISHFWPGDGGPAALNNQHNNFALRYSGEFQFSCQDSPSCLWQFWASSDDGSRLYVDDQLILDRWGACCDVWHADPVALTPGVHSVVLEYSQAGGGAFLELGWQRWRECPSASPLLTTYYPRSEIVEDDRIMGSCTSNVRMDWGMVSAATGGLGCDLSPR